MLTLEFGHLNRVSISIIKIGIEASGRGVALVFVVRIRDAFWCAQKTESAWVGATNAPSLSQRVSIERNSDDRKKCGELRCHTVRRC